MWFAALSPGYAGSWFGPFVERLLRNDPATLKLLRHNPFAQPPPKFVRAGCTCYRFTTRSERKESGAWWVREDIDEFLRPVRRREVAGL